MKRVIFIISILFSFITNTYGIQLKSRDKFDAKKPMAKLVIKGGGNRTNGLFTSPFIIPAKFYGEIEKNESGGYIFYIDRLKYITSWANGWTHGENDASGIIIFKQVGNNYKAVIKESIEIWDITKGEIRYFDDYYRRDEGLQKVKDRVTRINALVKFLKTQEEFPDYFGRVWFKTSYSSAFNKSVKKFLLNKNTKYPENLVGLYESGTVKRDIEEAIDLFFMGYNMNYFFNNILNESLFEID